jgi:cobalamin biosynthesis protein CobT
MKICRTLFILVCCALPARQLDDTAATILRRRHGDDQLPVPGSVTLRRAKRSAEESSDEVSSASTSSDEVSSAGTSSDKASADKQTSEEVSSTNVSSNEVSSDKQTSEGESSDEVSSDEATSEEVSPDEAASGETTSSEGDASSGESSRRDYASTEEPVSAGTESGKTGTKKTFYRSLPAKKVSCLGISCGRFVVRS